MVAAAPNDGVSEARRAERRLALGYAPAATRGALAALLALDDTLAAVLRTTREPLVGQMRLAWWREALAALAAAPPLAEPVLQALAREALPRSVATPALTRIVDGWEALLAEPPLDAAALAAFAAGRGGALFAAMAAVLGGNPAAVAAAGRGWALADLAAHLSDAASAQRARQMASAALDEAFARRWPRALRPLGALALLARADLAGIAPGHPRRVARLLRHRLTGG